MSAALDYRKNKASAAEIADHLLRCNADFVPPLNSRVDIDDYAQKIADAAVRFEAWSGGELVGLVAAYCNDDNRRTAFVTNVSVLRAWMRKGVAALLLRDCIDYARNAGMRSISLTVASGNGPAIGLYGSRGFVADTMDASCETMTLNLGSEEGDEEHA